MPKLGIGASLSRSGIVTPGIVTSDLVLKHNYAAGSVVPVSDGAADINADAAANEYIDVGTIEITTNDVSMCAWVYVTAHVDNAAIIVNRHASGDNQGIGLRVDSGNQRFEVVIDEATSGARDDGDDTYNLNQWYHVCGVWDRDDKQYLYVNGVLNDFGAITDYQDSLTHTTNVFIGKNQGSAEFRGYICNVGYWNEALTQAQIKSIMWKNYANLTDSEKTNLVSWWNLDSSFSGSVTNDELLVYDNHYNAGTDILGDNVLLDGTFTEDVGESASGTYWTTGAGWTISGGSATYDGGGDSNTQLDSAVNSNIVDGNVYQIKFDLTDTGGGGVYVRLNNTWWSEGGSDVITGTATHTIYARAGTGTNRIEFETGHDDKAFSLDNITIRKVNGNPGVLL